MPSPIKRCENLSFLRSTLLRNRVSQGLLIALVLLLSVYCWVQTNLLPKAGPAKLPPTFLLHHDDEVDKEKLEYAVMVDAGSSGSRVYVYVWPPHSGDPRELLQIRLLTDQLGRPVVKKVLPGLSSFVDKPFEASDYFVPLLQFAANNIPTHKHPQTPLYILATAGMRLLSKDDQELILNDIRADLPRTFSFLFHPSHVEVISGKQEGIYSWIAINYILGRFDHSFEGPMVAVNMDQDPAKNSTVWRKRTVGVLEMGGASIQVAFEVTNGTHLATIKDKTRKEHIAEVNLGCLSHDSDHEYHLYVATYLGFGANIARDRFRRKLVADSVKEASKRNATSGPPSVVVNPCSCRDQPETVQMLQSSKNALQNSTWSFRGSGNYDLCKRGLSALLNYTPNCVEPPCTLNNTWQPPIDYREMEFYGFSEFWYSMEGVLRLGGLYNFAKMEQATKSFCGTKWSILENRFQRRLYPDVDRERLESECFKASWLMTVLHEGFQFPQNYHHLHSVNMIHGQEVQWTLGALLHRTRFFPLRAIEQKGLPITHKTLWTKMSPYLNNSFVFIVCMAVVTSAIVIYLLHLGHMFSSPLRTLYNQQTSVDSYSPELTEELLSVKVEEKSHDYFR